ncbi:MAG: ATP-binding protein, partial [Pseudomonadota bacterium]
DFTREHGANLAMRYQGIVRQFIEQQGHFSELAISSSYAIGESWTQHNWIIGAAFLLGLALMFAASRFLIQSATAPLQALLTQTEHVADGFLDETLVGQDRPDEIGRLASAIERLRMIAEQHRRLSHKSRLQDREMELARLQTEQMRRQMATKDEQMAQHRKFVSIVSHEFRTPLTIIDAQARATLRRLGTQTQEQTAKRMNAIVGGVERLVDMIESVLSSARLEAGSLKAEPSRIDLGNLVADTVGLHSALNSTHEISVDVDELPQDFLADPKLLRQVITNLLTNAIKYSPNGDPIEVLGRLQGDEVVVSVVDQGVGIPPHEIAKLSTPYYRASTATGIPGTGIGLNIVRTFVEMHGGRLEIRSQTGKGSTFSVFLPAKGIPREDMPAGEVN